MNLQEKLHIWADSTADFYHEAATANDSDFFYTQSNLTKIKESPELLILGINPGSAGKYSEQIENPLWKAWGVNGRMNGSTLLKGNPVFNERHKWHFWKRLNNILCHGGISELISNECNFVYTNIFLFGTLKANELLKATDIRTGCIKKCIELITILNPKRILCLGKNDCFKLLQKYTGMQYEEIIPRYINWGLLNNIPVYGIPHTSKWYTDNEMILVGKALLYLIQKEELATTREEIVDYLEEEIKVIKERKPNIAKHIAMEVSSKISIDLNMIGIKNYDEKYKERYQIPAFDLNLSVTKSENGYVAIRHKNAFNSKYHYSKGNTHPFQEEIKSILQQYGYKQSHIWLGVKYFKEYGSSTNEIIDAIIKEIKDLLNKLNILSQAINKESLSSS